jgi:precorrin-4/cobalt-precorrin-4 C11-methyltransferase
MQTQTNASQGKFYLVSTGIGDADNMTLRAHKTIAAADVIIGLPFLRTNLGDLIDGKQQEESYHGLFTPLALRHGDAAEVARREDNARRIIRGACAEGKTVVLLDYGDTSVFSPQIGYIKEFADLHPEIIPGISSLNAANAALGKPILNLTSASLQISALDGLREKGTPPAAMVFFTMRMDIAALVSQLQTYYPSTTPVAIVLYAGFAEQQHVIHATIDTLAQATEGMTLPWEYLVYVGDVLAA